jgi:protein SCO1/2
MFIKIVIILLLLIVAASLLSGRSVLGARRAAGQARPSLRKLMMSVAVLLLVIGATVVTIHLSGCSKSGESAFRSTDISGAKFARLSFLDALTDHNGRRVASADFQGKVVIVFFGYTQCPDICPTKMVVFQETMRLLGPAAGRVQVLFVTVDPERDTQVELAAYVPWFDARFLGLSGDPRATRNVAEEFRVIYSKVKDGTALGYSMDHGATSYVFDPQGRPRLLIRYGETPQSIADDVLKLLAGH